MDSKNGLALTPSARVSLTSTGAPTGVSAKPLEHEQALRPAVLTSVGSAGKGVPLSWAPSDYQLRALSTNVKRFTDVAGAATGLVVTAPLMLLTAIAVKLSSKGPVLFTQTRVGKNGRTFRMYKFRTMCPDAEQQKDDLAGLNEMSGPVFKASQDPRVTKVGRFLRKYSIDELPQLVNVLSGKMSLVGPRPALPEEVSQYQPQHRVRLQAKPGLTCLWQVNGRNQVDFDEWMRLDLEYISKSSLKLDLRILAKTVPAVLKGTGV